MTAVKNKKEKKQKEKLSTVLHNNLIMIGKVAHFTPEYILWMAIMSIVWGVANAAQSYLMFAVLNECDAAQPSLAKILIYIAMYIGWMILLRSTNEWWFQYYKPIVDKRLQTRMHAEMFDHALEMDLACYDDPAFYNDYVFAMDESKERAAKALSDAGTLFRQIITFSAIIGLLAQVSISVGAIIIAACILQAVFNNIINKKYFKKSERTKPLYRKSDYVNRIYHLADFAKEFRISRAHENMQALYDDATDELIDIECKFKKKILPLSLINELISMFLAFMPMLILLVGLFDGSVKLGGYVAAVNLLWTLNWSITDMTMTVLQLPENARYAAKYISFMAYEPMIKGGELQAGAFETLEFKNVSFSYHPEKEEAFYSLKNVSFTVNKGERIAIVGYNGAGKTTLTKLVMRLYEPTEGEILYNGVNLKRYDISSLRAQIGAVFQDYRLFAATLGENVAAGERSEGDENRLTEALHMATFDSKLEGLERGLETPMTKEFREDGVNLSGGESQKVAIARIFARDYQLIIMDEPSSALDPMAEYELNHSILDGAANDGRTVIFISHRLSTTRMADRIYMFDSGALIESGSHDELMQMNRKYAEMFNLQAEKYREKHSSAE